MTPPPPTGRRRRIVRIAGVLALVLVVCAGAAVVIRLPSPSTDLADPPAGSLDVEDGQQGTWTVGKFTVAIGDRLSVSHPAASDPVWETPRGAAFVTAAVGDPTFTENVGMLRVRDEHRATWAEQSVDAVRASADEVVVSGRLRDEGREEGEITWTMRLRTGADDRLDVALEVDGRGSETPDRVYLVAGLDDDEGVHGLGAQSGAYDLRGRRVALIPREQGIGRGNQPLSFLVDLAAGAAGGEDTTYLVSGISVTDRARSVAYRGDQISSVDLRDDDRLVWEVWDDAAEFSVAAARTPLDAVAVQTQWTGVAAAPPGWVGGGAIAGLQGGTDVVRRKVATLREAGVPLSAVWLQDWSGRRTTSFGDRLQWNWTLDGERYPGWDALVSELAADGIRTLTYVNAYLSADSGKTSAARGGRDLYREAAALGHLVEDDSGAVLELDQQGFDAALVDLSSAAAREWFAHVIADEVAGAGASGWMADFAEGPPPDVRVDGGPADQWRARWPVLWQQVNARALELAGLGEEGLVWHRSGHTASAGEADALWLGDQMQDWSTEDGLASVPSLLHAAAASGMVQMHADVGGYTSLALPSVIPDVARDSELVARWAEASILAPVFRTHEGNRPDASSQPGEDPGLARRVASMARLFAALAPERARLGALGPLPAAQQHPWMLSPAHTELLGDADEEMQLGPDVLLAPVLEEDAESVDVTLPPGHWVHVWSGRTEGARDRVTRLEIDAPVGRPALFVRAGSTVAEEMAAYVRDELGQIS